MNDVQLQLLLTVLASIPGILALGIKYREIVSREKTLPSDRRKKDAESVSIDADASIKIGDAWEKLTMNYRKEIDTLKAENARMNQKIDRLEKKLEQFDEVFAGAHQLHKQVIDCGEFPVYTPPERRISEDDTLEEGV